MRLTFVETPSFTRRWRSLGLDDGDLRALQNALMADPPGGPVMQGTGGLRKVRFAPGGRGKSGAFRVIYLYLPRAGRVALVWAFGKNEQANLSAADKAALRPVVEALVAELG